MKHYCWPFSSVAVFLFSGVILGFIGGDEFRRAEFHSAARAAAILEGRQIAQDERAVAVGKAAETITETDLREFLTLIAHDQLRGRGTKDGGYEFPSLFLAREFRGLGIKPKGDRKVPSGKYTYFQDFSFSNGLTSRNVVAYIEGQVANEWVVIGAHYDHEGLGELSFAPKDGKKKIYPGADDNGSGVSAVLEVAEAFAELAKLGVKPRRNVLFCFWGAEEYGEIGSRHFIKNPPSGIELKTIVGYINLDMVGRNDSNELSIFCAPVPETKKDETPKTEANMEQCKDLYLAAERINSDRKLDFQISHVDSGSHFERSDQWSFYKADRGATGTIPCWQFFTGEHPDYHTPTDTADKINYPQLTRVARFAFWLTWEVAEMDGKPAYK
jgi:hypothetical protein